MINLIVPVGPCKRCSDYNGGKWRQLWDVVPNRHNCRPHLLRRYSSPNYLVCHLTRIKITFLSSVWWYIFVVAGQSSICSALLKAMASRLSRYTAWSSSVSSICSSFAISISLASWHIWLRSGYVDILWFILVQYLYNLKFMWIIIYPLCTSDVSVLMNIRICVLYEF